MDDMEDGYHKVVEADASWHKFLLQYVKWQRLLYAG